MHCLFHKMKILLIRSLEETDSDKVLELFQTVDENNNESADPWELHDWMLYVESHAHKMRIDTEWHQLNQRENDNLTWPDYVFQVFF